MDCALAKITGDSNKLFLFYLNNNLFSSNVIRRLANITILGLFCSSLITSDIFLIISFSQNELANVLN